MSRVLCRIAFAALLVVALPAAQLAASSPDYSSGYGDWSAATEATGGFTLDGLLGGNGEDPGKYASEVDQDFDGDSLLALNLSRHSLALVRSLGFHVQIKPLRSLNLVLARVRPPANLHLDAALAMLRQADPRGFYDFNFGYKLSGAAMPADACAGVRCYGRDLIGWDKRSCALAPRVGMVDSAVDLTSPALAGRRIQLKRLRGTPASAAENEHGTAIAALLAGDPASGFPGLLPDAELYAADVFSPDAQGHPVTDAARLVQGLDWVASFNPAVINVSIAGPNGGVLRVAVNQLTKKGIAVVAAAGNEGPQAPPQYPAAYPGVIAVTAVDRQMNIYAQANRGDYVALAAPGVGIWTPGAGGVGVFREGTSFAAPFATAALAVLRTRQPDAQAAALIEQLEKRARDLGDPGDDPVYGWGLLQSLPCS